MEREPVWTDGRGWHRDPITVSSFVHRTVRDLRPQVVHAMESWTRASAAACVYMWTRRRLGKVWSRAPVDIHRESLAGSLLVVTARRRGDEAPK